MFIATNDADSVNKNTSDRLGIVLLIEIELKKVQRRASLQ